MGIRWLASAFEAAMFYGEAARGARAPPGDGEGNQGAEPIIALLRGIAEWRRIRFNEHNEQRELAAENRCVKRTPHLIPLSVYCSIPMPVPHLCSALTSVVILPSIVYSSLPQSSKPRLILHARPIHNQNYHPRRLYM